MCRVLSMRRELKAREREGIADIHSVILYIKPVTTWIHYLISTNISRQKRHERRRIRKPISFKQMTCRLSCWKPSLSHQTSESRGFDTQLVHAILAFVLDSQDADQRWKFGLKLYLCCKKLTCDLTWTWTSETREHVWCWLWFVSHLTTNENNRAIVM